MVGVCGKRPSLDKIITDCERFNGYATVDPYYLINSDSYLNWVVAAASCDDGFFDKHVVVRNTYFEAKDDVENVQTIKKEKTTLIEYNIDKLSYEYPHKNVVDMPLIMSLSEISPYVPTEIVFEPPSFVSRRRGLSSVQRGQAIHKVMEWLDLNVHLDYDSVCMLLDGLVMKNILTQDEKASINVDKLLYFQQTDLAERMRRSDKVVRERAFILNLDSGEFFDTVGEQIIYRGIIDCYFYEDDGIVLVDYKSDRASPEVVAERYRKQLMMYKKALEKTEGKAVRDVYIYMFNINDYVELVPNI
jgi:ATP-dependent helicase/nuclease subunit A